MRVKYIRQVFRGLLFAEDSVKRLDPARPISEQLDKRSVGYRTFEREERTGDGVLLASGELNLSPWTYFGTVRTLAEVERDEPGSILRNMRGNGCARVVDVGGNVWPLNDADVVVSGAGENADV